MDNEIDSDLQDSIMMLEQILEVMPDDMMTLKALYNVYHQGGDRVRAFDYLSRLANAVIRNSDAETAEYALGQFSKFEMDYPEESISSASRLRALVSPVVSDVESVDVRSVELDIGEELSLAWRLYEEERLSQEEYSSVLHDLTEMSSKDVDVPVSVLHVLNDRGFVHMNRIMNYMSDTSGAPCLSLSGFDVSEDVVSMLPRSMVCNEGAIPFAVMGESLMVGVLNPFNTQLVERAESVSGRSCYTYLVAPDDYDQVLERVRAALR